MSGASLLALLLTLAPASDLRVVRVRVACDEEYRAQAGWSARARRHLAEASELFEREFALRLSAVEIVPWRSADDAPSIHDLLWSLQDGCDAPGIDLVLGLTGQARPAGRGAGPTYARGAANTFGRAAIVRLDGSLSWPYASETVAHEIAHVFGAWHVTDSASAMRPRKEGGAVLEFDATTRAVVQRTREFDFRRGVEALDDALVRELCALWMEDHRADALVPVAHAYVSSAARVARDGNDARALAMLRRAREVLTACGRADSREMLDCLLRIGRLEPLEPEPSRALDALEQAAVLEALHEPARLVALPWLAANGRIYGSENDALRAEQQFRFALTAASDRGRAFALPSALLHEALAWVLGVQSRSGEAIDHLEAALVYHRQAVPRDPEASLRVLRRLGWFRLPENSR